MVWDLFSFFIFFFLPVLIFKGWAPSWNASLSLLWWNLSFHCLILMISCLHCNGRLWWLMKKNCSATSGLNGWLPSLNGHGWQTVFCCIFPVWFVIEMNCLPANWLNDFLFTFLVFQWEFKLLTVTDKWLSDCLADWIENFSSLVL